MGIIAKSISANTACVSLEDWNNQVSGVYSYYAKNPPENLGWDDNIPMPTAIKIGDQITCNKQPSDYIDPSTFPNILYVDKDATGLNDGSSWTNAFNVIHDALLAVEASGVATRILVMAGNYDWGLGTTKTGNVTYMYTDFTIEAVYGRLKIIAGSTGDNKTWAVDGTYSNLWVSTNISQSVRCYDNSLGGLMTPVSSVLECSETNNSFYVTGSTVYVNRLNGQEPDNDFFVLRNFPAVGLGGKAKFLLRNIDTYGGSGGGIRVNAESSESAPLITESWAVIDNCTAQYAIGGTFSSPTNLTGMRFYDWSFVALFNCESSRNSSDGIGGTDLSFSSPYMLSVGCSAYENGTISNQQSCNGISMHQGAKLIDIGGYYSGSVGSNVGHVDDGTKAWHFGTKAGDSNGDRPNGGALEWGGFGVWGSPVEMWLDCCVDFGSPVGVHKSSTAICHIRNHKGTGTISAGVNILPSSSEIINVTPD